MTTRRTLLKTLAAPALIPGSAIGLNGATPPSGRVNLATIDAVSAARAGKDIYREKPLAHNLETGSWQRSKENFRRGCELVHNGYPGKIHTIEAGLPGGHTDFAKTKDQTAITKTPETPHCAARLHKNGHRNYEDAGGQLMDWVGHHVDIAH